MKEAVDPGNIRKVGGQTVTTDAKTITNKVRVTANKLVAKQRAKRDAAKIAVNLNPQIGAGAV